MGPSCPIWPLSLASLTPSLTFSGLLGRRPQSPAPPSRLGGRHAPAWSTQLSDVMDAVPWRWKDRCALGLRGGDRRWRWRSRPLPRPAVRDAQALQRQQLYLRAWAPSYAALERMGLDAAQRTCWSRLQRGRDARVHPPLRGSWWPLQKPKYGYLSV